MQIFPKCCPLARWSSASRSSSNRYTRSIAGSQPVQRDGARHRLEVVATADRDPLQPDVPRHDRAELRVHRAAREHADHADRPADPHGAQRLREGLLSADLDDMVDTVAARDLARAPSPLRGRAVVDALVGPHGSGTVELLVARGRDDHLWPRALSRTAGRRAIPRRCPARGPCRRPSRALPSPGHATLSRLRRAGSPPRHR